jgi:hypothetical protein
VLGLITHLQNPNVPLKNAECLRDLVAMYELLTIEDIITAYNQLGLGDDAVGGPVGGGGGGGGELEGCVLLQLFESMSLCVWPLPASDSSPWQWDACTTHRRPLLLPLGPPMPPMLAWMHSR